MKIKLQTLLKHSWRTLLLLCALIIVSQGVLAWTDIYLAGEFNNWNTSSHKANTSTGASVYLIAGVTYKFKFYAPDNSGTWFGYGDSECNKTFTSTETNFWFKQGKQNVCITASKSGTYYFKCTNKDQADPIIDITFPGSHSAPSALYIGGPIMNSGTWPGTYKNDNTVGYSKSGNTFTFSFNATNACSSPCSGEARHFIISTISSAYGKINSGMTSTRTGWSFQDNTEGKNFIVNSTLLNATSVPIIIVVEFSTLTGKFDMVVCGKPTAQTVSGDATICTGANTNVNLANSQSSYKYRLYKDNSYTSTEWTGSGSSHNFSVSSAGTYTVKAYYSGFLGCDSKGLTAMSGSASVTVNSNAALSGIILSSSSICLSGSSTATASGANLGGGTGAWSYSGSSVSSMTNTSASSTVKTSAITASSSVSGDATITYTITGGCGTSPLSKSATLTVNPDTDLNGATISFTPSATCNGNGTVASISDAQLGGGTGAWSWVSTTGTGTPTINSTTGLISGITDATEGSHKFCYTVTGGCGSNLKTKDADVTLGYSPIVSPITKTVKAYEPVSLTCTNANVNWAVNGGGAPTHYVYDSSKRSTKFKAEPGTYIVTATATSTSIHCPGASTIVVEADPACE